MWLNRQLPTITLASASTDVAKAEAAIAVEVGEALVKAVE
jgi:hypothetical protein